MCVYDLNSCLDVSQPQLPELETEDKNSFSSSFYRVCDAGGPLHTPVHTPQNSDKDTRIFFQCRLFCGLGAALWLSGKESTQAGGMGLIPESARSPGLARSPGEGDGNPLKYSCLENPMD